MQRKQYTEGEKLGGVKAYLESGSQNTNLL